MSNRHVTKTKVKAATKRPSYAHLLTAPTAGRPTKGYAAMIATGGPRHRVEMTQERRDEVAATLDGIVQRLEAEALAEELADVGRKIGACR